MLNHFTVKVGNEAGTSEVVGMIEELQVLERMIERGQTAGMAKKLDIFYAANKLTDEQYAELTEMLTEKANAAETEK